MARLFNVLNFSIHCKIIFISRQNNCVYVLLKYIKSLGSPQRLLCFDWDTLPWRGSGISPPRRFFFSEIVYIWALWESIRMRGGYQGRMLNLSFYKQVEPISVWITAESGRPHYVVFIWGLYDIVHHAQFVQPVTSSRRALLRKETLHSNPCVQVLCLSLRTAMGSLSLSVRFFSPKKET